MQGPELRGLVREQPERDLDDHGEEHGSRPLAATWHLGEEREDQRDGRNDHHSVEAVDHEADNSSKTEILILHRGLVERVAVLDPFTESEESERDSCGLCLLYTS